MEANPKMRAGVSESDTKQFQEALAKSNIQNPIAHASYLLNLASPDDALWNKSIDALTVEWLRADALQLVGLVMHPGASMKGTPQAGLQRIAEGVALAIKRVNPRHCRLLFENTAGQGTCLGHDISQIGWLIKTISQPNAIGVCWDTCHALAAGYDFRTSKGLKEMLDAFEREVGFDSLCAIHVNDSKKDCGSRVDRHEHIGRGCIGEAAFKRFLSNSVIRKVPMYLETAKETDPESGKEWDVLNMELLRKLTGR